MARSRLSALLIASLLLSGAVAARGDDWPQFRRDGARSGASSDPLTLPLTEIWSSGTSPVPGVSPTFEASVWRGRTYYITSDSSRRLVCADARTGTVIWQRQLRAS